MAIPPKLIKGTSIKIPITFSEAETDQQILKFIWIFEGLRILKTILKKNTIGTSPIAQWLSTIYGEPDSTRLTIVQILVPLTCGNAGHTSVYAYRPSGM